MIIDDSTTPRRALDEDATAATRQAGAAEHAPRRPKRGPWRLPRRTPSAGSRRPAPEHLMLVGPGGGLLWTSRHPR